MRYVSEEKQKNLLNASAEVFAEKGYYQASIQNITQKAGVSTGTFYIYYKNKEEVLLAIYQRFSECLNDMIEKKTLRKLFGQRSEIDCMHGIGNKILCLRTTAFPYYAYKNYRNE